MRIAKSLTIRNEVYIMTVVILMAAHSSYIVRRE